MNSNAKIRINQLSLKLSLTLAALLGILAAHAKPIDKTEAAAIAESLLGKPVKKAENPMQAPGQTLRSQPLYVFNANDGDGFAVVAGDDDAADILAYSHEGILDITTAPEGVKWLLNCYAEAVSTLNVTSSTISQSEETRPDIAPLLYTQWGQGTPYNMLCPLIQGNRCITGCVATAMAQVINYHRWPREATCAVPAYVTSSHHISMPGLDAQTFNWDNMSNDDVAKLMLYCGQAVQMDYGTDASGAVSELAANAFKEVFGFSSAASYEYRSHYDDDAWDTLIYTELSQSQPVFYSGYSPEGGHAFVIDGYSGGKYHVDWGWEGYCNGYFTLTGLNGFNSGQGAAINVCPPAGMGNVDRPSLAVSEITCSERNLERDSDSKFPEFNVSCSLLNESSESTSLNYALALYDDSGIISAWAEGNKAFDSNEKYSFSTPINLSGLADGDYRLAAVCRTSPTDEWRQALGSTLKYISLNIDGSRAQIMPMPKSENDMYHIDYGYHMIDGIRYHLYSEYLNNRADVASLEDGMKYEGDIYIPDFVMYQNMQFEVWDTDDYAVFDNAPNLISLSLGLRKGAHIYNCQSLKTIDIREGMATSPTISYCPSLESIEYPTSITNLSEISNCESLRTITIKNNRPVTISTWNESMWDDSSMPSLTDIYFYSDRPHEKLPNSLLSDSFVPNSNAKIHVPQNSMVAYSNSIWKDWTLSEDLPSVPIKVEWDYCGKDENAMCGIGVGQGDNDVEFAMRIPGNTIDAYKNKKITAIEYFTPSPSDNDWHDEDVEYVFITTPGVDYQVKQPVKTVRGTWMRVELTNPYVITGDDIFVGIGRHSVLGAFWANLEIEEDGLWLRSMGNDPVLAGISGQWQKNAGNIDWNHPLPIRAIIEGDDLPTDVVVRSIGVVSNDSQKAAPKKSFTADIPHNINHADFESKSYFFYNIDENGLAYQAVPAEKATEKASVAEKLRLRIINRSPKTVYEINLSVKVDGKELEPIVYDRGLMTNHEAIIDVDLPKEVSGRTHELQIDVNSIDGAPDMIPANSSVAETYSTPPIMTFPRRVVVEEATGTWCGYCPMGIAQIDKMKHSYPDNFIALAIHNDSEMAVSDNFLPFFEKITNYPSYIVNRVDRTEPLYIEMSELIDAAEVSVKSSASVVSGSEYKSVAVETTTIFGFDDSGNDKYKIAYVLTEDNVGPYVQSNYYSNKSMPDNPAELMNWWQHQDNFVLTEFNDVVREIYDDYYGIANSTPEEISHGTEYTFSHTFSVPDNIQNGENLSLVTLVLDAKTGEILNADKTAVSGFNGISCIKSDNISISKDGSIISVRGLEPGTKVVLYNITGAMIWQGLSDAYGNMCINVATPGVYILHHGGNSYKLAL